MITTTESPAKPVTVPITSGLTDFKVCSWNIRRGLVKRELELIELIKSHKLDIIFLVETDSNVIQTEKDYKIEGFKTEFHLKENSEQKTRMPNKRNT